MIADKQVDLEAHKAVFRPPGWDPDRHDYWQRKEHEKMEALWDAQTSNAPCLRAVGLRLAENPVRLPSPKYGNRIKVERTHQDLVNEMAQELSDLPRFAAYAKVIAETENEQAVRKAKIHTLPSSPIINPDAVIEPNTACCTPRQEIARARREDTKPTPKGHEPPPASFS